MTKPSQGRQPAGRREHVRQLLLDTNEPLGIAEIAERLGIHANTVRFHLNTLISNGKVGRLTAEHRTPGRPPQLFQALRGMDPMGPRNYQLLAEALITTLANDPEPSRRAAEAGRAWGRRQATAAAEAPVLDEPAASVDRLTRMLAEWGFAPEHSAGDLPSQIGLRNCPFLELAVDHADVVCAVHWGLMQGATESWNSPVTVERLDPLVEPDLCIVHLGAAGHGVGTSRQEPPTGTFG